MSILLTCFNVDIKTGYSKKRYTSYIAFFIVVLIVMLEVRS